MSARSPRRPAASDATEDESPDGGAGWIVRARPVPGAAARRRADDAVSRPADAGAGAGRPEDRRDRQRGRHLGLRSDAKGASDNPLARPGGQRGDAAEARAARAATPDQRHPDASDGARAAKNPTPQGNPPDPP